MGPYFAKQIESSVADIKNVGVDFWGENGAAAEFLNRFIIKDEDQPKTPWAHIDIAGVSWTKEDLPLAQKGVTGFGVRLLTDWLL
jgi:leucyl aminopeptidase